MTFNEYQIARIADIAAETAQTAKNKKELPGTINEVIEQYWTDFTAKYNSNTAYYARNKQDPAAQKDMRELTELGLIDYMPKRVGYYEAKAVIMSAISKGSRTQKGAMNAGGDGDGWTEIEPAGKLYVRLNS